MPELAEPTAEYTAQAPLPKTTRNYHFNNPANASAAGKVSAATPRNGKDDSRILLRLRQKLSREDDPQRINALSAALVRLEGKASVAGEDEGRDELVSRYRRAGYELPYST